MSLKITHRFLPRLTPQIECNKIKFLILGTFNPGEVTLDEISPTHSQALSRIYKSAKYRRFAEVLNFYDRPANRFWGVMDRIFNSSIFEELGFGYKHLD